MKRLWKDRGVRATSIAAPLLLCVALVVGNWDRGFALVASSSTARTLSPLAGDSSKPVRVASAESVKTTLSQLVFAANEAEIPADARVSFGAADAQRAAGAYPNAVRDYIMVIERFPNSLEAKAADARANFIMEQRSTEELDAIEAVLPKDEDLTQIDSLTVVGQYHYLRAKQLAETDPSKALEHVQKIYEMGWKAFQDKLDDDYKTTILDAYLSAADMLGNGDKARAALSEHANTLPPCFTAWLIKAVVDGKEPPFGFVTSVPAQLAVRKYYLTKANAQSDRAVAAEYYTKARDAAWQMLMAQQPNRPVLDDCNVYLGASNGLGSGARDKAVATVEEWIAAQPPSIMRWIVRYELAMFLTRTDCTAPEARAAYAHFETMIEEADTGMVEKTVADTAIDSDTRGLLMCMWGHAFAGTNRAGEATQFYRWVLGYFPEETHAGESAAYAVAVMHEREHYDAPESCIHTYEEFVDSHPGGFYGPEALVSVAKRYAEEGDQAGALATYERIADEYGNRSIAPEIEQQVAKMRRSTK